MLAVLLVAVVGVGTVVVVVRMSAVLTVIKCSISNMQV